MNPLPKPATPWTSMGEPPSPGDTPRAHVCVQHRFCRRFENIAGTATVPTSARNWQQDLRHIQKEKEIASAYTISAQPRPSFFGLLSFGKLEEDGNSPLQSRLSLFPATTLFPCCYLIVWPLLPPPPSPVESTLVRAAEDSQDRKEQGRERYGGGGRERESGKERMRAAGE